MVMGTLRREADVVVVGGGPGGYTAAIRAADLGQDVVLIERRDSLGGVCLLEGCIPSKTLISALEVPSRAKEAAQHGIFFEKMRVDVDRLRSYTTGVIASLSDGIRTLVDKRGIEVIKGRAYFAGPNELRINDSDIAAIRFQHCILATGSQPSMPERFAAAGAWSSTDALAIPEIPKRLLVIGGGYIGLELGTVYARLGSEVTIVEMAPSLLGEADPDLVKPVYRRAKEIFKNIYLNSRVEDIVRSGEGLRVDVIANSDKKVASSNKKETREPKVIEVDRILVAVGRRPNTAELHLEEAGISVDDNGFIPVDQCMRSSAPHLFAIGDIVAGPGLAHKASREAKVAAEVISGQNSAFDNLAIPAVVFCDPEVSWVGLSEADALRRGLSVKVGKFPHSALGRAQGVGQTSGMTKVISEAESGRVLGVGIVGPHASELIAEAALALELGAVREDLRTTIHPHPTFSESLVEAVEVAEGFPIHVHAKKSSAAG